MGVEENYFVTSDGKHAFFKDDVTALCAESIDRKNGLKTLREVGGKILCPACTKILNGRSVLPLAVNKRMS